MIRSRRMVVTAVGLGLAGCVASPGARAGMERARYSEADSRVLPVRDFAPTTPAATHYNAPSAPAPQTSLGAAMAAAIAKTPRDSGVALPLPDARLFRACQELAQLVPEEGVVPYHVVEFVLHRHGIVEPSPHLLVVWGELDDRDEIVAQLQPRLRGMLAAEPARFGIAAAARARDGSGAVVFAMQSSHVRTAPIPRALPAEARLRLEANLAPLYRGPNVLMLLDDGRVQRLPVTRGVEEGAFSAELSCAGRRGRQQIEINALYGLDRTVLANFPVWCGEAPPSALRWPAPSELLPISSAGGVEQQLLSLINRDRLALGLPALRWDEPVAAVGRANAAEMRASKRVTGQSPSSGSASDRLRTAGLSRGLVLQNVARTYGIEETHAGLMNLPSTRESVLSPDATHIGIGVALGELVSGRPEMFVSQVITRINPKIDPSAVAAALHARITAVRPLPRVVALDQVAQLVVEDLASGKSRETAWSRSAAEVKALSKQYVRVASTVTAFTDIASADVDALLHEGGDELGIGIAQGPHPQLGDGATWVVLLAGDRKK